MTSNKLLPERLCHPAGEIGPATTPAANALRGALQQLMHGIDFSREEAYCFLNNLLLPESTDAQIGAALAALSIKGETSEELAGMALAMREKSLKINYAHNNFIDTAGTGSSRSKTFNVSTAAAFVIAGAGLPVAKHGSRASTSKSGSADVLAALGVNVYAPSAVSEASINEIGICFMFAPQYHSSTARVAGIRREMGVNTTFNLLGPMTNPASAPFQVMGVWDETYIDRAARALSMLGTKRAWIVHGRDGLDEVTVTCKTRVAEVEAGRVKNSEVSPSDFGIEFFADISDLCGGGAEENALIITDVFEGRLSGAARALVVINAAAALYVAGKVRNLKEAADLAGKSLDEGWATAKLRELIRITNETEA
jgi:anthranilate phosphoribosyltransferase